MPPPEHDVCLPQTQAPQTSAPTSERQQTGDPLLDTQSAGGGGNAHAVSMASDSDTCEPVDAIESLREAVQQGTHDAALTAFDNLGPPDLPRLRSDRGLLEGLLVLLYAEECARVIRDLQFPVADWLRYADAYCFTSPDAMAGVLTDAGILSVLDLIDALPHLAGLTHFADRVLLDPLLAGSAEDQAMLLGTPAAKDYLAPIYEGSPLVWLTALEASSEAVLAAFTTSDTARAWLMEDAIVLSDRILGTWATCGLWLRALWVTFVPDLMTIIELDPISWGTGLLEALGTVGAGDQLVLIPGDHITNLVFRTMGEADSVATASIAVQLGLLPIDTIPMAHDLGWLDTGSVPVLLSQGRPDDEHALAVVDHIVSLIRPYGDADQVLIGLATDELLCADAFMNGAEYRAWLSDNLDVLLRVIYDPAMWVPALVTVPGGPDLLVRLAKDAGDLWRAAVDANNKFDDVLAGVTPPTDQDSHAGLFNLLGDATTRSRDQLNAAYPKLFASTRLLTAGQKMATVYPKNNLRHTDGAGNSYDVGYRPIPIDPTDAAFASFFNIMRRVTRSAAAASNTLQFAAQEEFYWRQTAPVVSAGWHAWSTPVFRNISTSYAGGGVVTIQAYGTGATELGQVVADNGAVSNTRVRTPVQQGDVVSRRAASDQEGTAASVGGGEDRTATGGLNQRTVAINYFQNHAIHEFGHSTGAALYDGVGETGNTFATRYGGWEGGKSAGDFKAATWTASNADPATPDKVTDPVGTDHVVTADDVAAWLTGIVSQGSEPTGNTMTAAGVGLGQGDKLGMLAAVPKFAGEEMFKYVRAVLRNTTIGGAPAKGYQFTGYTPTGDAWIYATRNVGGNRGAFAKYDKAALDNCRPTLGWYSLSSPVEMFAEAFTSKYAGGAVPASRGAGKNFDVLFQKIESSPSITTQAGATPALAGAEAALIAGEVEPSSAIVP